MEENDEVSSQRKIRKYIRKPIKNTHSNTSDKNNNNSSNIEENTQQENDGIAISSSAADLSPSSLQTVMINPTRRRVIVPVRRSRLRPQPFMLPSKPIEK